MADKKISQLTGATTPLDGTEVLPLVQSGSTVKVANNDLRPKQIQATSTSGILQITGPANSTTRVMTTPNANFTAARTDASQTFTGDQIFSATLYKNLVNAGSNASPASDTGLQYRWADDNNGSRAAIVFRNTLSNNGAAWMSFWTSNSSNTFAERIVFDKDGNQTINNGNLIVGTAGKGIDFSAATHAAGMTSELLNDYEEGTYTVAIGCGTSGTVTLNSAYDTAQYTKVGRLVTVTGGVIVSSVSSPTGYFTISLPFTSASLSELSGYFLSVLTISGVNAANMTDFVSLGVTGASAIRIYLGDATSLQGDSAQELKANTEIYFTVSYIAA